jgi:hypothetical protein
MKNFIQDNWLDYSYKLSEKFYHISWLYVSPFWGVTFNLSRFIWGKYIKLRTTSIIAWLQISFIDIIVFQI